MLHKPKSRLLYIIIAFFIILLTVIALWKKPWQKKAPVVEEAFKGIAHYDFSQKNALDGWEEKIFKGKVKYTAVTDRADSYLEAKSRSTASGLVRWIKFNPRKQPLVSWKWKVISFPELSGKNSVDGGWIEKDDYAARFYVIFPKFPFFRMNCLEYVWDKDLPVGTVLTNSSFGNLKIIVVDSGKKNLNSWITVKRDIVKDFQMAFGSQPPEAGAIAVMTDSDNTQSYAEAQYTDIRVGYEK